MRPASSRAAQASQRCALPDPLPARGLRCFSCPVPSTGTAPVCDWRPSLGSPGRASGRGSEGKTFISHRASSDGDMVINVLDVCLFCCWVFFGGGNSNPISHLPAPVPRSASPALPDGCKINLPGCLPSGRRSHGEPLAVPAPGMVHSSSPDLLSLLSTQRGGFFPGRKVGNSRRCLGNSQCLSEQSFKGAEGKGKKTVAEKDFFFKKKGDVRGTCKAGREQGGQYFGKAGMETCRDDFCIFRKVNSRLSLVFFFAELQEPEMEKTY